MHSRVNVQVALQRVAEAGLWSHSVDSPCLLMNSEGDFGSHEPDLLAAGLQFPMPGRYAG